MIQKIKHLFKLEAHFDKLARNSYDANASILLHKLFPANTILPFTPFSLNPNTILHIVNDVQVNSRKQIIEFGAGVSTLVLAKFIKDNKLPTQIIAFEDNEKWATYINNQLQKYDCAAIVKLHYVPLKNENNQIWYNKQEVQNHIKNIQADCIIVDGPSAKNGLTARLPALEAVINTLNTNFIIFLDDIRRTGEQQIFNQWITTLKNKNKSFTVQKLNAKVYATLIGGESFAANPLSH